MKEIRREEAHVTGDKLHPQSSLADEVNGDGKRDDVSVRNLSRRLLHDVLTRASATGEDRSKEKEERLAQKADNLRAALTPPKVGVEDDHSSVKRSEASSQAARTREQDSARGEGKDKRVEARSSRRYLESPFVEGPLPDYGQTSLYARYHPVEGIILKWGISKNPTGRYTARDYSDGSRMVIVKNFDTRTGEGSAEAAERYLVERWPGPHNREPWAGRVSTDRSWTAGIEDIKSGEF